MKRLLWIPTALLVVFALIGCDNEESLPRITRINVSPECGIAPLQVEVYGTASGGDESGDATGGVNNLEYKWDFGDGTGSTSINYHRYTEPGDYQIKLTVTDPDGKSDSGSVTVSVVGDSLVVEASMSPETGVTTDTPVDFSYRAKTCGIDPDRAEDYVKLNPAWRVSDPAVPGGEVVYDGDAPTHTFSTPGTFDVVLTVFYPAWGVYRSETLQVEVTAP